MREGIKGAEKDLVGVEKATVLLAYTKGGAPPGSPRPCAKLAKRRKTDDSTQNPGNQSQAQAIANQKIVDLKPLLVSR